MIQTKRPVTFRWVARTTNGHTFIYSCPLQHLDRLANRLCQDADRPGHPMTSRLATRVIDEARVVRTLAGMLA